MGEVIAAGAIMAVAQRIPGQARRRGVARLEPHRSSSLEVAARAPPAGCINGTPMNSQDPSDLPTFGHLRAHDTNRDTNESQLEQIRSTVADCP
jgi:hypothetical protein